MKTDYCFIIIVFIVLIIIGTFTNTNLIFEPMNGNGNKGDDNKGVGNALLGIAAIIGGAWLTAYMVENFSKKEVKYSCPNCSSDINYKQDQCHVCHSNLKWDF